ncbi:MAG: VOC family protein, partial [Planctomycetota bacterium]
STHWTEFATDGATLALHVSDVAEVDEDQHHTPAGRCRPGLSVPDLDAFHERMVENSVPCIQEPKDVFGARLAQYLDPDGLVISVGEERSDS